MGEIKPDGRWRDAELMERLYHEEDMTMSEIGDELGCSTTNISKWMKKHGIQTKDRGERHVKYEQLNDEEWLREKYHGEGMVMHEVADLVGCTKGAIEKALERHGIESHSKGYPNKSIHPIFDVNRGYWRATSHHKEDGEWVTKSVRIHRLIAIAEYGFEAVCNNLVHHKNGIPWDNRPGNLEVMSRSKHQRIHNMNIGEERWDRNAYTND